MPFAFPRRIRKAIQAPAMSADRNLNAYSARRVFLSRDSTSRRQNGCSPPRVIGSPGSQISRYMGLRRKLSATAETLFQAFPRLRG